MPISLDEAINLIVERLRTAPVPDAPGANNLRPHNCDLWVSDVAKAWWHAQPGRRPIGRPPEIECAPFHDGAWELSRRGILRPGPAFPFGIHTGHSLGDGYSLTSHGIEWIAHYNQPGPFPLDPGRFAAIITPYAARFGQGFLQRANEAAGCYRALNYLACCAMTGAACESILLALAIKKNGDEAAVLKMYRSAGGRKRILDLLSGQQTERIRIAITTASNLLSFWRDETAHGTATAVGEFEAHDAMSRLLRFAQFVESESDAITN